MQITILSVTDNVVPTAKGSYNKLEVAYKGADGKIGGKNVVSFANKPVYELLKGAKPNEVYEITNEKIGDNWNWTAASKSDGSTPTPTASSKASSGTTSPKSTYETPEERAKKQVYIVRQSSLSTAVEFSKNVKALKNVDEIIAVAKQLEAYVFGIGAATAQDVPEIPADEEEGFN